VKTKFFVAFMLFLQGVWPAWAGLLEPDGFKRVRVAEVFNKPAAQLLILQFDSPLREIGKSPPAWQTWLSETESDTEKLDDIMTISAYDMIITGNADYASRIEGLGLLKRQAPIWKEKLILAGPADMKDVMDGLGAEAIMKKISAENLFFFSLLADDFVRKSEYDLWKKASVDPPLQNSGYVETNRDDLSALLQTGDEGGFILVGEGSYAQYVESERFEPALVKIADTAYLRTTSICLLNNSKFRKIRAEDSEKYLEWFLGEDARRLISGFSMGGINPFMPNETPKSE
jgi:ABC-type tungstate transport system permease subunit